MGTDWKRNQDLDGTFGPNQYGFEAQVLKFVDGVLQMNGAQPVKWGGDKWDVNSWRLYLGAWRPKSGIDITDADEAIVADFAYPEPPGANFTRAIALTPAVQLFANIKWGSGSVRHQAWVDWPLAGLLCQVSGSYVEVNVVGVATIEETASGGPDLTKFPNVAATLSDEPGGGDSSRSGTFTYPFQSLDWGSLTPDPVTGNVGINFPIPPFARSVFFAWDNTGIINDAADYATEAIIRFRRPAATPDEEGVYVYKFVAGDIGDPREGIPVPPLCAYVRVEFIFPVDADPPTASVGCTFELDL